MHVRNGNSTVVYSVLLWPNAEDVLRKRPQGPPHRQLLGGLLAVSASTCPWLHCTAVYCRFPHALRLLLPTPASTMGQASKHATTLPSLPN